MKPDDRERREARLRFLQASVAGKIARIKKLKEEPPKAGLLASLEAEVAAEEMEIERLRQELRMN